MKIYLNIFFNEYPRINVIKARILEGKDFIEKTVNLIPHLEDSLKNISKMFNTFSLDIQRIKSKKQSIQYNILLNILNNLNVENQFVLKLKKELYNYNIPLDNVNTLF